MEKKINVCLSNLSIDAFCNAGVQPLLGKAPSACVLDNGLIKWKYELRNQIVQYESVTSTEQNNTFIYEAYAFLSLYKFAYL